MLTTNWREIGQVKAFVDQVLYSGNDVPFNLSNGDIALGFMFGILSKDGIKQLNGYLDSREQRKGYLVSFSFLKNKEYTTGYLADVKNDEVPGIEDKKIYEVVV